MTLPSTRPTSAKGPAWLTFIGVALLLATVGLLVFVVNAFIGIIPTGVIDPDGGAGDKGVTSIAVPGSSVIDVAEPGEFTLYLVQQVGNADAELSEEPTVFDSDMVSVPVSENDVSMTASSGGYTAHSVATFSATEPGRYTVKVPALETAGEATVVVATGISTGSFVGGLFGTVGGALLAGLFGIVGLGLTIAGSIWWSVRRGRAKRATTA
jgi:hypothetical protein